MITIVLIQPKIPGNIGAVARVMKNLNFQKLVIIDPQCDIHAEEAIDRSKHAKHLLLNVEQQSMDILKTYDLLIGTTAKTGTDYNISRVPLTPRVMAEKLARTQANIAILFGPEDIGLTNDIIEQCDFTVTIPASDEYPTMNLSHSAAIILYELSALSYQDKYPLMSAVEKRILHEKISAILDNTHFSTPEKREIQKKVWKRIFAKAMLTKREAFAVLGLLRKLE